MGLMQAGSHAPADNSRVCASFVHLQTAALCAPRLCTCRQQHCLRLVCAPADSSIVCASGKMEVLDRLLGKLKKRGHRVVLFSQVRCLLVATGAGQGMLGGGGGGGGGGWVG